jgi:DNA-binding PucR family transcriptional regulator
VLASSLATFSGPTRAASTTEAALARPTHLRRTGDHRLPRWRAASLVHARGGAEPLLATLEAYFATGGVATESAKRLHVSVRTVTYRLERIKKLSGYNPADPAHRFSLQAAVLGAKALNWPEQQLPTPG